MLRQLLCRSFHMRTFSKGLFSIPLIYLAFFFVQTLFLIPGTIPKEPSAPHADFHNGIGHALSRPTQYMLAAWRIRELSSGRYPFCQVGSGCYVSSNTSLLNHAPSTSLRCISCIAITA